jgi:hypothetical protein
MKISRTAIAQFVMLLSITGCATTAAPTLMVGGSVASVDSSSKTLTVTTPMGSREVIRFNEETQVYSGGVMRSLVDLSRGDDIRVDYVIQPDGDVLARAITIGYVVPSCSCGTSCSCPLSRGCKVVRY